MTVPQTGSKLSSATILKFYWPLAISWLFMGVEGPVCTAAISQRAHPVLNTAAFLILMNIALLIESPIIDLLTTSTTLSQNRTHYLELRRFVLFLVALVTASHAVIAFTPVYWIATEGIIGVPHEVAQNARLGLMLMLPWAGAIAWRRYLQGILIRNGKTRFIGLGTVVRVTAMSISVIGMFKLTDLPGVQLAGLGLIAGVVCEATFIHIASLGVLREAFGQEDAEAVKPLGLRKILSFHTPLVLTTLLTLCGTPIVSAAISRLPSPVLTLAGFQVGSSFLWLFRSSVYALPEVVITLQKDEVTALALKRFCVMAGVISTGLVALFWLTTMDAAYFTRIVMAKPDVVEIARLMFITGALFPFIASCQSYLRGMLTANHLTVSRLVAVGVAIGVLALCLVIGVLLNLNGILVASGAVTISLTAELGVLAYTWRKGKAAMAEA